MDSLTQDHQHFDFLRSGERPPVGRLGPTQRDVEDRLFFEKLPTLILSYFQAHQRLRGANLRAALKILHGILSAKPIDREAVAEEFGVAPERMTFVVDYVTVQVRRCLLGMRSELERCRLLEGWGWRALIDLYEPELVGERR